MYTVRWVIMYSSVNINEVLYILQLLSAAIVYTCALKSHMNIYQRGRNQSREE